eukprot:3845743-Pyramimonas_sp.AAC.3
MWFLNFASAIRALSRDPFSPLTFFLCGVYGSVNTPTKTKGLGAGMAADLTYWESAARYLRTPHHNASHLSRACSRGSLDIC